MYSRIIDINGYKFKYSSGAVFGLGDGVVLTQLANSRLIDPYDIAFQIALITAMKIAPAVHAACYLNNLGERATRFSPSEAEYWYINPESVLELYGIVKSEFVALSHLTEQAIRHVKAARNPAQFKAGPKAKPKGPQSGFVYLLKAGDDVYKIGCTTVPDDRITTFGVKLPFEVEIIALIQTNDMKATEKELHSRYENKRIKGEFFRLSPDDVSSIQLLPGNVR